MLLLGGDALRSEVWRGSRDRGLINQRRPTLRTQRLQLSCALGAGGRFNAVDDAEIGHSRSLEGLDVRHVLRVLALAGIIEIRIQAELGLVDIPSYDRNIRLLHDRRPHRVDQGFVHHCDHVIRDESLYFRGTSAGVTSVVLCYQLHVMTVYPTRLVHGIHPGLVHILSRLLIGPRKGAGARAHNADLDRSSSRSSRTSCSSRSCR